MKKIWPWLLLLLLLIILCVWSKKDTIHVSDTHAPTIVTPVVEAEHYIEYVISQHKGGYSLNGNFKNIAQQEILTHTVHSAHKTIEIQNTSTNETLIGEPALALTNQILPHFMATYTNGKISYSNQKIKITGTAKDYEAQHEMQRLLNTSTLASQDNSTVAVAQKSIHYVIHKTINGLNAKGTLANNEQMHMLLAKLPEHTNTDFNVLSHHIDKGSLLVVEKLLPTFMTKYTHGKISYENEVLTVDGAVESDADLATVKALLSHGETTIVNHTVVDNTKALATQKEAQAKLAALQAQKDAHAKQAALDAEHKAEAKKAKLAALQAQKDAYAKQAALDAEHKAEAKKAKLAALQAQKDAYAKQAVLDAKNKEAEAKHHAEVLALEKARLEKARKSAQAQLLASRKQSEIKAKIAHLLALENIEFNVNKSTLTAKGQKTVNKLGTILKEYTSVHIEIAGHTDSDGSAAYNQKLSQSRVDTVKRKLIADTINASRLTAKGYGELQPLVPNNSKANKQKNRRVEINILGE
jgi:outer membrane protein OmpA-like peptidoglycan-associated protein